MYRLPTTKSCVLTDIWIHSLSGVARAFAAPGRTMSFLPHSVLIIINNMKNCVHSQKTEHKRVVLWKPHRQPLLVTQLMGT